MKENIVNPFEQTKKINWAKKAKEKINKQENLPKNTIKNKVTRIAKSFKIFPGEISRNFDKRVNKMQVKFDDLNYQKNHVDSGKYIMFLMAFAEKFELYELYEEVNSKGELKITEEEIKKILLKN